MKLNRGINLGGFLSQCDHTEEHYASFITEEDIRNIANVGFDHVRLPIDCDFFLDNKNEFVPAHFEMLDKLVCLCKEVGLNIILDLHKAPGYDFNDAGNAEKNNLFSSEELQLEFLRLWDKIAASFGKYEHVALELLNEVVESENADAWNKLIKRAVATIRKHTKNTIIYGGIQWNSAMTVKLLEKPEDVNIVFTFHFYEPLWFTHQKAYWVPAMDPNETVLYPETMDYFIEGSKKLGYQGNIVSQAVEAGITEMGVPFLEFLMKEAIEAAKKAGVPLYCGEFGVIDRAPLDETVRWYTDADTAFRKFDIGCAAWTYRGKDFGLVDEHFAPIYDKLIDLWIR
ncbi:MAG: glycoside hydrolase family 5 protein [Lachnospiraceae bacterium]|nr:glycoside hydrolase family 5 protein [Lachnospiraceae bacterium]